MSEYSDGIEADQIWKMSATRAAAMETAVLATGGPPVVEGGVELHVLFDASQ